SRRAHARAAARALHQRRGRGRGRPEARAVLRGARYPLLVAAHARSHEGGARTTLPRGDRFGAPRPRHLLVRRGLPGLDPRVPRARAPALRGPRPIPSRAVRGARSGGAAAHDLPAAGARQVPPGLRTPDAQGERPRLRVRARQAGARSAPPRLPPGAAPEERMGSGDGGGRGAPRPAHAGRDRALHRRGARAHGARTSGGEFLSARGAGIDAHAQVSSRAMDREASSAPRAPGRWIAALLGVVLALSVACGILARLRLANTSGAAGTSLDDPEVRRELVTRLVAETDALNDSHPDADVARVLAPSSRHRFEGVDVATNRVGMRERDYAIPKPAGLVRVVVLGDSFVFGIKCEPQERLGGQLERLLREGRGPGAPDVEVLSLGVSSWN